jgi:hypothetical protein
MPSPLEQQIVHGPELVLSARGLGSFRRQFSVRMHFGQGEMAEDDPNLRFEMLEQQFDR